MLEKEIATFEGCLRRNREIFIKHEALRICEGFFYWRDICGEWNKTGFTRRSKQLMEQYTVELKEIFSDKK